MDFTTTSGQLYIVELLEPFERLEFQFVPEPISWDRQPDLAPIPIVGRNNPRKHYTGGEDRLSFQLEFYADEEDRDDVRRKVMWLRSLTYNDGSNAPIRNIKLVWGTLFRHEVWVVSKCAFQFMHFDSRYGYKPLHARVDLTLDLDPIENLRLQDVRN